MKYSTSLASVLEFVALAADTCERYDRQATISIYLRPDAGPLVVVLDMPFAALAFHNDMAHNAAHCDLFRASSFPTAEWWEYHYEPLPEVADLLSNG